VITEAAGTRVKAQLNAADWPALADELDAVGCAIAALRYLGS
jgi:hypothetical protein